MEPVNAIEAIRTLGFPVATALALAAWTLYQDKEARKERAAFLDALKQVSSGLERIDRRSEDHTRQLERLVAASDR